MSALRTWRPETLAVSLSLAMLLEGTEPANDNSVSAEPADAPACAALGLQADRTGYGPEPQGSERDGGGCGA